MASSSYHPFKIALTYGEKKKTTNCLCHENTRDFEVEAWTIRGVDELLLTATQINRLKKATRERKGADLKFEPNPNTKTAQQGANLFSSLASLAKPLIKAALGALASAGLSLGPKRF